MVRAYWMKCLSKELKTSHCFLGFNIPTSTVRCDCFTVFQFPHLAKCKFYFSFSYSCLWKLALIKSVGNILRAKQSRTWPRTKVTDWQITHQQASMPLESLCIYRGKCNYLTKVTISCWTRSKGSLFQMSLWVVEPDSKRRKKKGVLVMERKTWMGP